MERRRIYSGKMDLGPGKGYASYFFNDKTPPHPRREDTFQRLAKKLRPLGQMIQAVNRLMMDKLGVRDP